VRARKIIHVDMDGVLADFRSSYDRYKSENPALEFPQSEIGFFRDLNPIDSAISAVNQLRNLPQFNIYVLTAPSTRNSHSYAEKRLWIEEYFDYEFTRKLIICREKNLIKGDYLIDDNTNGCGQDNFSGELLHFGSKEYPNWESIMNYLKGQYDFGGGL